MDEADFFGIASGENTDKFAITGLTALRADHVDAPCIVEFPVVLECRVSKQVKIGAHTQFTGEILDVKIDESMLDSEGMPDLARLQLIGFDVFRSEYYTQGPVVGKTFSCRADICNLIILVFYSRNTSFSALSLPYAALKDPCTACAGT